MSVLRKKIYREMGLPEVIGEARGVWDVLFAEVSDCLTEMSGSAWELSSVDIVQVDGNKLFANLPDTGLAFGLISDDERIPVFANFDTNFAKIISSTALSVDLSPEDDAYQLQMLDLILAKPLRDIVITEVSKLLLNAQYNNGKLSVKSQGLSHTSFVVDRGFGTMNEVTFKIKQAASEKEGDEAATTDINKETFTFTLTLPQSALQQMSIQHLSFSTNTNDGEQGPWADQIYKSMKTAIVPIRGVVETCTMTVADCTRLEVDDIIKLPGASLQSVSLQTEMREGTVKIGRATLGVFKSNWALKLSADLNEEIFVSLKSENVETSMEILKE